MEPCEQFSKPCQIVNAIDQMVPWCGSLLVLDEEECIIQFAHHTVKEYLLLESTADPLSRFRFTLADVDHEVGEACCTYLQFNDFKRQTIRHAKTQVDLDPKFILKSSLSTSSIPMVANSWLLLERFWKNKRAINDEDVWRRLGSLSMGDSSALLHKLQTQYLFLAYCSENWLSHTANLDQAKSRCWGSWKQLVLTDDNALAAKPWTIEE